MQLCTLEVLSAAHSLNSAVNVAQFDTGLVLGKSILNVACSHTRGPTTKITQIYGRVNSILREWACGWSKSRNKSSVQQHCNGCETSHNLNQALRRPCPLPTIVDACWLLKSSSRTVSFQVDQHNRINSQCFSLILREQLLPILHGSWEKALRRSAAWSNALQLAKLVILDESVVQNTFD